MSRGGRKKVHRSYYPHVKQDEDPREIKPTIKADPIITYKGVHLEFLDPDRSYTPGELRSLASWLYALSHEAEEVAKSGFISEAKSYDTSSGKVLSVPRI